MMVIGLGSLSLKTEPTDENVRNIASMHGSGVTSDEILKAMLDRAYDKFILEIENIQVNFFFHNHYFAPYFTRNKNPLIFLKYA